MVVFDVSEPKAPKFVQYVNNRNFNVEPETDDELGNPAAGDLGPEGLLFISDVDSPNGRPLLVVGNEISGTTTIYEIKSMRSRQRIDKTTRHRLALSGSGSFRLAGSCVAGDYGEPSDQFVDDVFKEFLASASMLHGIRVAQRVFFE